MEGFEACHPDTAERLRSLDIRDNWIKQGVGYAAASAGTHEPIGQVNGRDFGCCVDIWYGLAYRNLFDHLAESGFFPFVREGASWEGNEHIHCVDYAPLYCDDGSVGQPHEIVLTQMSDWVNGRNGLRGHSTMPKAWMPSVGQRAAGSKALQAHSRFLPVQVRAAGRYLRGLYAYFLGNVVRSEFRPLVEGVGAQVMWSAGKTTVLWKGSQIEPPASWGLVVEGNFTRCNAGDVLRGLGFDVKWDEPNLVVSV